MRVKSGLVLAGRYVLSIQGAYAVPGAEVWEAADARLGAPVTLLFADATERASVKNAAERARTVRDPRLARIIEAGISEAEPPEDAGVPYVVLEHPAGLSVASLLSRRLVPAPVARALVGEAALVLVAAAQRGLRHGGIVPELLTVTDRGRVVVAGAGVVDALVASLPGRRAVTQRDDALALGLLFVRAVSGRDPVGLAKEDLPPDLTRAERDLAYVVSQGTARPSLSDIIRVLGTWDPRLLRALPSALLRFPVLEREPVLEVVPITDELPVLEVSVTPAWTPTPAPTDEDDGWGLDVLEDVSVAEEAPSILEALLAALSRRFPRSAPITHALERVRARVTGGPQINATRWFLAGGIIAIILVGIWAFQWMLSPFVPTIDLHNPPPHHYPEYTFGPLITPSPDS